jgi:hypothetical protein
VSRAPQGTVIERIYRGDEDAQVRALMLLANRAARPNKAATGPGGESDPRGDMYARINRGSIPQSK